jgi:predicted lipoprotein with Yx(FWY)xxD motif
VRVRLSTVALRRLRRHAKLAALATAAAHDAAGTPHTSASRVTLVIVRSVGAARSGAIVSVRHTRLGDVLVDSHGRTLYLFDKDRGAHSSCFGTCAAVWPALTTSGS